MLLQFQPVNCNPLKGKKLKRFLVELAITSSILDNITNFQVFQDDQNILEFIMCNGLFKGQEIDDTPKDKPKDDELEGEDGIINLKTNLIPNGMVDLERIFDWDESTHSKRSIEEKEIEEYDSYNLGIEEYTKMVRIRMECNPQEWEIMLQFLT